jgi:hypothetical protein
MILIDKENPIFYISRGSVDDYANFLPGLILNISYEEQNVFEWLHAMPSQSPIRSVIHVLWHRTLSTGYFIELYLIYAYTSSRLGFRSTAIKLVWNTSCLLPELAYLRVISIGVSLTQCHRATLGPRGDNQNVGGKPMTIEAIISL